MTDTELLAKIANIASQWQRKMWTDTQAMGNIVNALQKAAREKGK